MEGPGLAGGGARRIIYASYLREPRRGFRSSDWRTLVFLRLGLLILKVPLPTYSA